MYNETKKKAKAANTIHLPLLRKSIPLYSENKQLKGKN